MGKVVQEAKTNTLALVGFIMSFFLPTTGAILSFLALDEIKNYGEEGKGFAIAGIIIGLASWLLLFLIFLIYFMLFFFVFLYVLAY